MKTSHLIAMTAGLMASPALAQSEVSTTRSSGVELSSPQTEEAFVFVIYGD